MLRRASRHIVDDVVLIDSESEQEEQADEEPEKAKMEAKRDTEDATLLAEWRQQIMDDPLLKEF